MADIVIEIRGMTCDNCVNAVIEALFDVSGVESANVTLDPPRAEIKGANAKLTDVLQSIAGAGFTPVVAS